MTKKKKRGKKSKNKFRKVIILTIILFFVVFLIFFSNQEPLFTNISSSVFNNPPLIEGLFPGGVIFDFDSDGDQDLLIVDGLAWGSFLYRNDGDQNDDGTPEFTDVSKKSGIKPSVDRYKYAQGACYGDIDNDGDEDLYILFEETLSDGIDTDDGRNYLYLNQGGSFVDISHSAGVIDAQESGISCAFSDVDNDGFIDLYISNYLDGDLFEEGLQSLQRSPNTLFYNNGDLTFTDITEYAFPDITRGSSREWLSFVSCFSDYDGDNDQDLFIANDIGPVQLYQNQGNQTFRDVTEESGLGVGGGWMGCAFGDVNGDGHLDMFVTNVGGSWAFESVKVMDEEMKLSKQISEDGVGHALYLNDHGDGFYDIAPFVSVKSDYDLREFESSMRESRKGLVLNLSGLQIFEWGWGEVFLDYDNDGDQDLFFTTNFDIMGVSQKAYQGAGPGRFFENTGDTSGDGIIDFLEKAKKLGLENSDEQGNYLDGRTIIKGDLNNDGFIDLVLVNAGAKSFNKDDRKNPENRGSVKVFLNKGGKQNKNNWLVLTTIGTQSNRDGFGTKIVVKTENKRQVFMVDGGSGLGSHHDRRVHIGLGDENVADISLYWPSGVIQEVHNVKPNQFLSITEPEI